MSWECLELPGVAWGWGGHRLQEFWGRKEGGAPLVGPENQMGYLKGQIWGWVIFQRLKCLGEKGVWGVGWAEKARPALSRVPVLQRRDLGNPLGLGLSWKEVEHSPRAPRGWKKTKRKRGSLSKWAEERVGVSKGSWVCLQGGGLLGLAGGPRGRQRSGSVPPLGAGLGKPHPEGLAVYAGQRQKQQQQQEEEEEEKQPQPGLGEEKAAQAGGGGWVPGRRLWKDKVRQEPWELSQGGLGHGGWTREGQGQHCWWRPPPPRRAVLTCVPAAAAATAVGLGVPNPGAPAPLCRAAGVLHLLWLSLPAPLSLPGDGERGREGPRGSQSPLP